MGIFKRNKVTTQTGNVKQLKEVFNLLTGYQAVFTSFDGGLYEMSLTRSCIDKIAAQCSKLHPVIGDKRTYRGVNTILQNKPNRLMTTQQFLYRLVTILLVENNAYIVPIFDSPLNMNIIGFYPARADGSKVIEYEGIKYLKYKINNDYYVIEYDYVGVLRRYQYKKEYLGENNSALKSTLDLISVQEQGIKSGIKSGAMIRFLAKLGVIQNKDDIKKEQQRLKDEQLSMENNGGVLIFDNKYTDIKQVDSKPFIIDKDQMGLIKQNVFDYFHMSEEILQNTASEDQWNLFYEDVIEPIAIQISQVLTNMLIKEEDIKKGISVVLESTKLQFVSNNTKLQVSQQLFDRGILTINQVMDIWNLPRIKEEDGGDKRYIRKEYTEVQNLDKEGNNEKDEGNSNDGKESGNNIVGSKTDEGNSNDGKENTDDEAKD